MTCFYVRRLKCSPRFTNLILFGDRMDMASFYVVSQAWLRKFVAGLTFAAFETVALLLRRLARAQTPAGIVSGQDA